MRPELQERIAQHHADHPPRVRTPSDGNPGALAVATSADLRRRRVVLVTAADGATKTLNVLLASNRIEMATDLDVIVRPEESGAPYDLVVQGELYGPIFQEQLDGHVGHIDTAATRALAHALDSDGESLDGREVGTPLGGVDDPRRVFKDNELEELMDLVATCRMWLANGRGEAADLDPGALFPPPEGTPLDDAQDALFDLQRLLDRFEAAGHRLSFDVIDLLEEESFSELQRWRTEYGFDLWARLWRIACDPGDLPAVERAEDVRSTIVTAYAAAGVSTLDQWTVSSKAWEWTLIRTSDRGICRSRALVGVSGG